MLEGGGGGAHSRGKWNTLKCANRSKEVRRKAAYRLCRGVIPRLRWLFHLPANENHHCPKKSGCCYAGLFIVDQCGTGGRKLFTPMWFQRLCVETCWHFFLPCPTISSRWRLLVWKIFSPGNSCRYLAASSFSFSLTLKITKKNQLTDKEMVILLNYL